MLLAVYVDGGGSAEWCDRIQLALPEIPCRIWDEKTDAQAVSHAAVWKPPAGGLAKFRRLRCIVSLAAGVDHVLADPLLPPGVPILRLSGSPIRDRMREYVALYVLALHRDAIGLLARQARREWWRAPEFPAAGERHVGLMGLGELGADCARTLAGLGFRVSGWSRRPKRIENVRCFAGAEEFTAFLETSEILVNLLPLTHSTRRILDARLFSALPRGSGLLNAGRGEHLVERDLLDALDSGRVHAAVLDSFEIEPLPPDHPFWIHPRIWVTPHVGAPLSAEQAAGLVADAVRGFEAGAGSVGVDRRAGY